MNYEIIIKGHLPKTMAGHFKPLQTVLLDGGCTRLTGFIPDQAALFGLLSKIRDFNIELIALQQLDITTSIELLKGELK